MFVLTFSLILINIINVARTQERLCTEYSDLGFHCVHFDDCDIKFTEENVYEELIRNENNFVSATDRQRFLTAYTSECGKGIEVCCHSSLFKSPQILCGERNEGGIDDEITEHHSGISSKFGEWPHVCIILEEDPKTGEIISRDLNRRSASLIGPNLLLTGARNAIGYKLENQENLVVRCGDWHLSFQNETKKHQRQKVSRIIVHPEFNKLNMHNNYALIITKGHFRFLDHIRPICLPDPDLSIYVLNDCFTSGWGKDRKDIEHEETVQKTLKVDLIPHNECQRRFRKTILSEYFELDKSFICGEGYLDQNNCHGDGGSPLVCHLKSFKHQYKQFVQVGITSWGLDCSKKYPDAFANVMYAMCWIEETVRNLEDEVQILLPDGLREKCRKRNQQ